MSTVLGRDHDLHKNSQVVVFIDELALQQTQAHVICVSVMFCVVD